MPKRRYKKQTILLFEVDTELANSIKLYLEDIYTVRIVHNSEKLVAEIKKNTYNFFISDLNSFNTHFDKIITEIRLISPNIKIILMCTFFDSDFNNEKLILNKIDDFILKPFNVNLLKNKISKLQSLKRINTII